MEFEAFPKIQRYEKAHCTITEKIDGTNGCIIFPDHFPETGAYTVQSRKRIITAGKQTDNAGFAGWVEKEVDRLYDFFGVGRHYGEWWGVSIQRGYDQTARYFTPFNSHRFSDDYFMAMGVVGPPELRPLPVLWQGPLSELSQGTDTAMDLLKSVGSIAAPGYVNPEGWMIYSQAFGYLKVPFENAHKWELAG